MQINLKNLPIFYINMDRHDERNNNMIQLGNKLGLKKYTRITGTDMPDHPKAGCATSHYNIFKNMSEPTVILEDDCVIINKNIVIDVPDDADAIYLGISRWGYVDGISEPNNFLFKEHKDYPDIYKINGMLSTHAILYISEEYIKVSKRVAKWYSENDQHIDQGLALIQKYFNVYALGTPIFYQHTNKTATNIRLSKM